MNFDSSPSTIYVTSIEIDDTLAVMHAVDAGKKGFVITIGVTHWPRRWFAETIEVWLRDSASFPLISQYDEDADEWFVYAGNYGIRTRDLHFTPKA